MANRNDDKLIQYYDEEKRQYQKYLRQEREKQIAEAERNNPQIAEDRRSLQEGLIKAIWEAKRAMSEDPNSINEPLIEKYEWDNTDSY